MSMKVLIVDPDWRFARQATNYLESHAHLVVHHTSPSEAAAHAEHWGPDLAIVAAELADSGIIGSLSSLESRPALLLTGRLDRFDLAWRAWQQGGHELLMKPVLRWRELHVAIVTALENAAAGTRAKPLAATA